MNYLVYSLNHHCTPLDLRERLFLDQDRIVQFYDFLSDQDDLEGMVLFTCNRTEVILHHSQWESFRIGVFLAEDILERICALPRKEFSTFSQIFWGEEAVRHCFRVASGLDSMVLGEPQILGQWKEAFRAGERLGGVRTYLKRLGERTLQIAKRVRSETQIGEYALTIPSLVVALAEEIFARLDDKEIYVLGAGEMGDLTLRYFRDHGARKFYVLSRTLEHAQTLAGEYGGRVLPFSAWQKAFGSGDIVVISLAAYERIFSFQDLLPILQKKTSHPSLLFDLSVPRVVDPQIRHLSNLFFYTIDDLRELSERHRRIRQEEIGVADELIDKAVARFSEWYGDQRLAPLLARINHVLEEIRREEFERSSRQIPKRKPEESMEILSQAIIRKLMNRFARYARLSHDESFLLQLLQLLEKGSELEEEVEESAP